MVAVFETEDVARESFNQSQTRDVSMSSYRLCYYQGASSANTKSEGGQINRGKKESTLCLLQCGMRSKGTKEDPSWTLFMGTSQLFGQ